MRANYRELPRFFAVMSSLPPPALRFYLIETDEPERYGNEDRVQEVFTNLHPPNDTRFSIYQEHRFHPDKYRTNVVLNYSSRNPRSVHTIHWWFTGFSLQSRNFRRDLHEIPVLDMDTRLIQDLLFEQSHHVSLTTTLRAEDIYRTMMNRRFNILSLFPTTNERYNDDDYHNPRRRLSFSLRDLERPMTPARRRHYDDDYDDRDYYGPPAAGIPPTPRQLSMIQRPSRNIIIQPRPRANSAAFSLPKFVQDAILESHMKNDKACSITMIPFKELHEISITSCYHCFQKEALSRWMAENQSCPECRAAVEGVLQYVKEAQT